MWRSKKLRDRTDSVFSTYIFAICLNRKMHTWHKESNFWWYMRYNHLYWSAGSQCIFLLDIIWINLSLFLDCIILCFGMQCLFLGFKERLGFIVEWRLLKRIIGFFSYLLLHCYIRRVFFAFCMGFIDFSKHGSFNSFMVSLIYIVDGNFRVMQKNFMEYISHWKCSYSKYGRF